MENNFYDCLSRPIRIQDKGVILIPDLVGPVPLSEQHQFVELASSTNTSPSIHVKESDIEEMREMYPGTPVYGMWNTLITSGLISLRKNLQVIPLSDDDGCYIHCDLGRIEFSGDYEAGFFAADASFNLQDADVLHPEYEQLVLPQNEAKMAVELQKERRNKIRTAWSHLLTVVVLIISVSAGANFGLNAIYDIEHKEVREKTVLLDRLRDGLDELRMTRLTEVPSSKTAIDKIAVLWSVTPLLETDGPQSFQNRRMTFKADGEVGNLSDQIDWLKVKYIPEGGWYLSFLVVD